jgi:hypothetical protein
MELVDRVRSILETRRLTLHTVSQKSEAMFGHASPHVLPHNFYYELNVGTFSPSLHQIFALSKISDYRMADWLHVFGFDVEELPRLQIVLPTKRTTLLDSSLGDPYAWVPWFRNKSSNTGTPAIAPLSQLLEVGPAVRQKSLFEINKKGFLYARIGRADALAFPDLVPGSIVRINPKLADDLPTEGRRPSSRIFLVEHAKGMYCCRLLPKGKNRILLVSAHLPYAQVELQLPREARILGAVDLEIRPLAFGDRPEVANELAKRWKPEPMIPWIARLSHFIRAARAKTGLSLREASALSRRIATLREDDRYFISASSLSDYEARDTIPRHFQKVVSLCLLYAMSFRTFLETVGIPEQKAGRDSIPDRLIPRLQPVHIQSDNIGVDGDSDKGFLGDLVRRMEDIPAFLKHTIDDISGLTSPSLRSFFWIGGVRRPLHRYLENALLISVDRRRKRPVDSRSRPHWEQSLYAVLKRDGTYICGPCAVEDGTLVMHPDSEHLSLKEEFRNHQDAEVVGQVCAVVRKLA